MLVIAGCEGSNQGTGPAFRQADSIFAKARGVSLGTRPGQSWRKSRYQAPHLRESLMARGLGVDTCETAVSWSNLELLHAEVSRALAESAAQALDGKGRAIVFCHLSHSYPEGACLYFTAIFPRSDQPLQQWRTIKRAATEAMLAHGGTLSHHHGVGADHAEWLAHDKGELGFKLLGAIASTLDPSGVMATGMGKVLR